MHRAAKLSPLVAVVLAGAAWLIFSLTGGASRSPVAQAAQTRTSCAQALMRDWADGRIDRTYPVACYRAALRALPADLEVYSSAADDIAQALRNRLVAGARRPAG